MKYYAVFKGRKPGIYKSWKECNEQIHKFKGAKYKSFDNIKDAETFLKTGSYQLKDINDTKETTGTKEIKVEKGTKNKSDKKVKSKIDSGKRKVNRSKDKKYLVKVNDRNLLDTLKTIEKTNSAMQQSKNEKLYYVYFENFPGFIKSEFKQKQWKDYYYLFTDGSFKNDPTLVKTSGYGLYAPGNLKINKSARNNQTNNYNELMAIQKALESIPRIDKKDDLKKQLKRQYIIVSDSQYSIKSMTQYMFNWINNGWKTVKKEPVKNLSILKRNYFLMSELHEDGIPIGFLHVRSHKTEPNDKTSLEYFLWRGNKCADILAVGGKLDNIYLFD